MLSDVFIERIPLEDGFEQQIRDICIEQSSRDEPRKLVSVFAVELEIILVFELDQ